MHVMRRIFTYFLAGGLFLACVYSNDIIPQNMSYGLMSSVKRNALKDRKELYEDMKALVQNGMISIELYSDQGELVETLNEGPIIPGTVEFREKQLGGDWVFDVRASLVRNALVKNEDWQTLVPPVVAEYIQKNKLDERVRSDFGEAILENYKNGINKIDSADVEKYNIQVDG